MQYSKIWISACLIGFFVTIGGNVNAVETENTEKQNVARLSDTICKKLIAEKEETDEQDESVYERCGFNDEARAWSLWAPYASMRKLKKALFELCRRYPDHEYGLLYCQKAADEGYAPALAHMGFRLLKEGDTEHAVHSFTQALKTGDLSAAEKTHITEALGQVYLKKNNDFYDPKTGVALLSKASKERSAVSNNILGYLHFFGKAGLKQNTKQAFTYFFRAVLLGCPAAEENLGAFHLAQQKKISAENAETYMKKRAFSCSASDKTIDSLSERENDRKQMDCPCSDILAREKFFRSVPYLYVAYNKEKEEAILQDEEGFEVTLRRGMPLPDMENAYVYEIREKAVILLQNGNRIIINRYHEGTCVEYCLDLDKKALTPVDVQIKSYRLSFTEKECADLMYYASYLVDTTQPFVGKEECAVYAQKRRKSNEAAKLLLEEGR